MNGGTEYSSSGSQSIFVVVSRNMETIWIWANNYIHSQLSI